MHSAKVNNEAVSAYKFFNLGVNNEVDYAAIPPRL